MRQEWRREDGDLRFEQGLMDAFSMKYGMPRYAIQSVRINRNVRLMSATAELPLWARMLMRGLDVNCLGQLREEKEALAGYAREYIRPRLAQYYRAQIDYAMFEVIYTLNRFQLYTVTVFGRNLARNGYSSATGCDEDRLASLLAGGLRQCLGRGPQHSRVVMIGPAAAVILLEGILAEGERQLAQSDVKQWEVLSTLLRECVEQSLNGMTGGTWMADAKPLCFLDPDGNVLTVVLDEQGT